MSEPVFFSRFEGRIDRSAGVIKGVRIITPGPAQGHDLEVDSETVRNILELSRQMPDGIKTKLDHRSGVGSTNGRITNLREEGGVPYGDWHLLKSHTDFELIMDLAETQPNNIGFSLSADGAHVPVKKGSKTRLARFTKIYSCDLVGEPAANPGLFEVPAVDTREKAMTDAQFSELKTLVENQGKAQTELTAKLGKMETFFEAIKKEVETDGTAEEKSELAEISRALTELAVKHDALAEAMKTAGQKAAGTSGERTDLEVKTAAETELQAKMAKAKTDLEAAHGLRKYSLAGKFEKEFGKDWKTKLTQLEAKK